ncbi:MAG: hypothetical protein RLZZ67_140 [Candidatus Parcubacteria bacterium]|jgi:hypothetical protein
MTTPTATPDTAPAAPVSVFSEIDLSGAGSINVLLLKFTFTNAKRIPPGIEERKRDSDFTLDMKRASAHGMQHFGAVRQGRFDNGKPVVEVKNGICARTLRKSLRNTGATPLKAHWFQKTDGKVVVVLEYALPGHKFWGEPAEFPPATLEAIRALARFSWQFCQIYKNTPQATGKENGTITVNFGGLQPENQAVKNMLEVEGHQLMVTPFAESTD